MNKESPISGPEERAAHKDDIDLWCKPEHKEICITIRKTAHLSSVVVMFKAQLPTDLVPSSLHITDMKGRDLTCLALLQEYYCTDADLKYVHPYLGIRESILILGQGQIRAACAIRVLGEQG